MYFRPLLSASVTGDFCIEDEKTGLQFGHMGTDTLAVLFK